MAIQRALCIIECFQCGQPSCLLALCTYTSSVPGLHEWRVAAGQAANCTMQIGFPVMIKATAGGGGRGMRLAMEEGEFMRLLQQAQQEAESAFGNPDMYLERFVNNPRHIEFQVQPHRQSLPCTKTVQLTTVFDSNKCEGSLRSVNP